jgi:predicted outer membrane repeat protein
VIFRNCRFIDNSGGEGAAVYCRSATARFQGSRFEQNQAGLQGGAFFCGNGATPRIEDCVFTDNTALQEGNIAVLEASRPHLARCTFSGNQARSGGVVYAYQSSVAMEDCLLADNHSTVSGGACFLKTSTVESEFTRCTLKGNGSVSCGGINAEGSALRVQSCTFAGNHCTQFGAGLRIAMQSTLQMEDGIVAFSTQGQAIYTDSPTSCQLSCCDLYGNAGGDWTGHISSQLGVNGNIARDPRFCTTNPLLPYLLSADSPCAPGGTAGCGLIGAWPVGCGGPQVAPDPDAEARALLLGAPRPSPFGSSARVEFSIPTAAAGRLVRLDVLDAAGRHVCGLVDGPARPGLQAVEWDGRGANGRAAPGGYYFFRLECAGSRTTTRGVLLR